MTRPRTAIAAVLVAWALAGCGKGQDAAQPATAEEVIAEAGKLEQLRPGKYQTDVELIGLSVPGLSSAQAERVKSMMGNAAAKASTYCLTPDEAAKGFADSVRKMTEGTGGMKCAFDRFEVTGAKVSAELSCTAPQGLSANIALDGTAGAERSQIHMTMEQKAAMLPGGKMNLEMEMKSQRTGECG